MEECQAQCVGKTVEVPHKKKAATIYYGGG